MPCRAAIGGRPLARACLAPALAATPLATSCLQVPSSFKATALQWTRQLAGLVGRGFGYFHYVSVQGEPVLLNMRVGKLTPEHFAALFLQRHAPGEARPHEHCPWTPRAMGHAAHAMLWAQVVAAAALGSPLLMTDC